MKNFSVGRVSVSHEERVGDPCEVLVISIGGERQEFSPPTMAVFFQLMQDLYDEVFPIPNGYSNRSQSFPDEDYR